MWDLIVSVPDHCLSFYFIYIYIYIYVFFFFFFFFEIKPQEIILRRH